MALFFESFCMDVLLAFAVLCLSLYLHIRHKLNYWRDRQIVSMMPNISNMLKYYVFGTISFLDKWTSTYGMVQDSKVIGGFDFLTPFLVVLDPEIARKVLVTDFQYFIDREIHPNTEGHPLLDHLINVTGSRWKPMRQKLTPTFSSGRMKMMFQVIAECAEELRNTLDGSALQNGIIDANSVARDYTTQVIGSAAFGIDLNILKDKDSEFRRMGISSPRVTHRRFIKREFNRFFPWINKFLGLDHTADKSSSFFKQLVEDTMRHRKETGAKRNDYFQILLQVLEESQTDASNKNTVQENTDKVEPINNFVFGEHQLSSATFVFFSAGFGATTSILTFTMYLLAMNPYAQKQLHEELDALMEPDGRLTYDLLQKMTYLDACINETLRLFPPAPVLPRHCTKPYTLPGTTVTIPTGMLVAIPVYSMHHDERFYPDAERFDPERFIGDRKNALVPGTFLPFGDGPRTCIDASMSLLLLVILIILLVLTAVVYARSRSRIWVLGTRLPGPPPLPVLGNMLDLGFTTPVQDKFQRLMKILQKYPGGLARFWVGNTLVVVLQEPRHVEALLNSNEYNKAEIYNYMRDWLGYGITTAPGNLWAPIRKLLNNSFNTKAMERYLRVFNNNSKLLTEEMRTMVNDYDVNLTTALNHSTLASILATIPQLLSATAVIRSSLTSFFHASVTSTTSAPPLQYPKTYTVLLNCQTSKGVIEPLNKDS